jgi:lipopolysaccharide transport system permease protein
MARAPDPGEPVVIHTAEVRLRGPGAFRARWVSDLRRAGGIGWALLKRDLRGRLRHSPLSLPLALAPELIVTLWASVMHQAHIVGEIREPVPYPVYVLVGMALWTTFAEALLAPLQAVAAEQYLLSRSNVPSEAVVVAGLGQLAIHAALRAVLVAAFLLGFRVPIAWTLLLAPAAAFALIVLGAAFGLIFSAVGLLSRDVGRALGPVVSFWFFATPVFFEVPAHGFAAAVIRLNPVTPLLVVARSLAIGGELPLVDWTIAGAFTIALLAAAWTFHRIAIPVALESVD